VSALVVGDTTGGGLMGTDSPRSRQLRIAYFGLPVGALLLQADGHEITLAVLSPVAQPGERRLTRLIGADRVLAAARLGTRLDEEVDHALAERPADLLVSWFWTRRLPERWLRRHPRGAIGAHPSLLPRHRGRDPFFWTIDSDDTLAGVTIHELECEYDTGAVLAQQSLPVGGRNAWELARALDRVSLPLLRRVVDKYSRHEELVPTPQDERLATLAPAPSGALLRVDWAWPTARVLRRVRALAPVPGLAIDVLGLHLAITAASAAERPVQGLRPGEAATTPGAVPSLCIATGDGAIAVDGAVACEAAPFGTPEGHQIDPAALARWVEQHTRCAK
jgi:methionyl-tRNA formyltransferase